jgi:uncharacterized caspase-like protein
MAGKRWALLIGASDFTHSQLSPLPSSQIGLIALTNVLKDPLTGGFDEVEVHSNGTLSEVTRAVERLVETAESGDLILLYYIGHGLLANNGDLRLTVADSDLSLQRTSTLAADWLVTMARSGRAGQAVIILDCCYSGLDLTNWPSGGGHSGGGADLWVLSSSGATEVSYDRRIDVSNGHDQMGSVFTGVLVEGLRSGSADLDGDGLVHIDELAQHVILEVPKLANQTPVYAAFASGRALIARVPAVKPEPATRRTVGTRGYGDRPATEDLLRRHGMLQAFRALVMPQNHVRGEEYAGPTVIALDGAWGVGKTSVIELSVKLLEHGPSPDVSAEQVERMSAWAARKALGRRGEALWTEKMVPRVSKNGKPSLVTSRFEPWAHQTGEQVWAGLTRTLLEIVNERFLRDDTVIERYWFQRNIERVDRARLRRSLLKEAASPLFAVTFLALLAPIVAQMARSTDIYRILGLTDIMGANIAWVIVAVALAGGIGNLIWRYRRPAADYLPAELFVGPITSTAFADNNGDEALRDPYRNARSGYLYLLQHDVFAALDDVKKAGHHIVLFVDDLDRCSSRTTAEVFEAINLFVNRSFPVTRFVLCLDTTAVAAHLDETHSALRGKSLDTDDPSPGWSFLRKLIQLTIPIPVISPDVLEDLVDQLLPKSVTDAHAQPATVQATVEPAEGNTRSAPEGTSTTTLPSEATTSAAMELLEHDGEVRTRIVERLRDQPVQSVREVKRILTAWQYFVRVLIAVRTTQPVAVEEAKQLVVLAEISSRWPAALRPLRRSIEGKCGLGLLAAVVDDDLEWVWTLRKLGLHTGPHEKCVAGLRELLRRYNGIDMAELAAELH